MKTLRLQLLVTLLVLVGPVWHTHAAAPEAADSPYASWENGPSPSPDFFPIAVWLQNPSRANAYKSAGINTYVGLWQGPTDEQLATLTEAGMLVICHQNATGLRQLDNPTIIGWMHGDEPDNAQSLGEGRGYGPPILPESIVADYQAVREKDPSRPILLNLGQGVAWDGWYGRGVRTRHPEDYPEYVKGCDIASFDIYPASHDHPDVKGNLWYVAHGVERLRGWTQPEQIVWNCIECTRIVNPDTKATPEQVRSEVWMGIIHGSMGIIYFVHEWEPKFNEAALLSDPEMLTAVTAINRRIHALAPVLNSPSVENPIKLQPDPADLPIATMVKRHNGRTYLFAAEMRGRSGKVQFTLPAPLSKAVIEVLDEARELTPSPEGTVTDTFQPYAVHLYQIMEQ